MNRRSFGHLITLALIFALFLSFPYIIFVSSVPNDLSENDPDLSETRPENIDGTMGINFIGEAETLRSGRDGFYEERFYVPDFTYAKTHITVTATHYSLTSPSLDGSFNINSDTPRTIEGIATGYAKYSDVIVTTSASSGERNTITVEIRSGASSLGTKNLGSDSVSLGSNQYALWDSFGKGHSSITQIVMSTTSGSNILIDCVKIRYHDSSNIATYTPAPLTLNDEHTVLTSSYSGGKREFAPFVIDDLNADDSTYFESGSHAYVSISLECEGSTFLDYYETIVYDLNINYDPDGNREGVKFEASRSYTDYAGSPITFLHTVSGYSRDVVVRFYTLDLIGSYVTRMDVNDPDESKTHAFLQFNETTDHPIWRTRFSFGFSPLVIPEGTTSTDLYCDFRLDIHPPSITNHATHSEIDDYDDSIIFSVSGEDEDIAYGTSGLFKAYLILEDKTTSNRHYLELENRVGDTFSHQNSYSIFPSSYDAWYVLLDRAGNWVSTPYFELTVNGEGVYITDYDLSDYEHGTTGNKVSFRIHSHYAEDSIYNFSIEGIEIQSGAIIHEELIEISIDGYERGVYQTLLWFNDSLGNYDTIEDSFRVYSIPVFTSTPDDWEEYEWYGDITLEWDVEDEGLDNYTLYRNAVSVLEDDFGDPYSDTVSYTFNTETLGRGDYTFTLVVRNNQTIEVSDSCFVEILLYTVPTLNILSPSITTPLTEPKTYDIRLNVSKPLIEKYPVISVGWSLSKTSANYTSMIEGTGNWDYEASFNILDYEASPNYVLSFNISIKDYTHHYIDYYLELLPRLTFTFEEKDIVYNNDSIYISYLSGNSTIIEGQVAIYHDPIVKNRHMKVILPNAYRDDATNYRIFREFTRYTPSNPYTMGSDGFTLWDFPSYRSQDLLRFDLAQPYLSNQIPQYDWATYSITMDFTVFTPYGISNVTIRNRCERFISNPSPYHGRVYYSHMGQWVELNETLYEIDKPRSAGYFRVLIYWDMLGAGSTLSFRLELYQEIVDEEPLEMGMGIVVALMLGVAGAIFWVLTTAREGNQLWWKWGNQPRDKLKYALLTVAVIGGLALLGFFIGIMIG